MLLSALLAGCASTNTNEPDEVASANSGAPSGVTSIDTRGQGSFFNPNLIDQDNRCWFWSQNFSGRNDHTCAGVTPSCGSAVNFGQLTFVDVDEGTLASPSDAAPDGAKLVTDGFFRVPVDQTLQRTRAQVGRLVAREGCDLVVIGAEESIRLNQGVARRYLRVQWGMQQAPNTDSAQTTAQTTAQNTATAGERPTEAAP